MESRELGISPYRCDFDNRSLPGCCSWRRCHVTHQVHCSIWVFTRTTRGHILVWSRSRVIRCSWLRISKTDSKNCKEQFLVKKWYHCHPLPLMTKYIEWCGQEARWTYMNSQLLKIHQLQHFDTLVAEA